MPDDVAYFCHYVNDLVDPLTGRWIHTPFAVSHDKIPLRMETCREMYVEILKQRMKHEQHLAKLEQLKRNV